MGAVRRMDHLTRPRLARFVYSFGVGVMVILLGVGFQVCRLRTAYGASKKVIRNM